MAKGYYVKFETPQDLVSPILEAIRVATQSGKVKNDPRRSPQVYVGP